MSGIRFLALGAVVLLVAGGCSDGETAVPASASPIGPTVAPGTTTSIEPPATSTTLDPTQPPWAGAAEVVDPREWLQQGRAGGLAFGLNRPVRGDSARMLAVYGDGGAGAVAMLALDAGTGIVVPSALVPESPPDLVVVRWLDRFAFLHRTDSGVVFALLDPTAGIWSAGPDLGIASTTGNEWLSADQVGDDLIVSLVDWGDAYVPNSQAGAVVTPDLEVQQMAAPPAPIPMYWNAVAGGRAILIGLETQAFDKHLRQPWVFDPVANEWTAVANPPWIDCGPAADQCAWYSPHEVAAPYLAEPTAVGLATIVPDGSVGLLDPAAGVWRRMEDPPVALLGPITVHLADGSLLLFTESLMRPGDTFGVIPRLDPVAGTWTTTVIEVPDAPADTHFRGWFVALADDAALLAVRDGSWLRPDEPAYALGLDSGELRPVAEDDRGPWRRLDSDITTTDELIAAYSI